MTMKYKFMLGLVTLAAPIAFGQTINAAGATFPAPIYQKWFNDFRKLHTDMQVNYQALGSGAGIRQLAEGTVDFGASDKPMSDEEIAKITKYHVLHFPTVLGAVVPVYNIDGVSAELKFTPEALAGIFLGKIAKWDDAAITKTNPGVKLPQAEITLVHRSDNSGTTFVWTDYLSKVSPEWKSKVGADAAVKWPVAGLGGKGNDGVAGLVKQTPNSIGYVELIYAAQNKMGFGQVRNSSGTWVKPSFASVTEAAAGAAKNMPDDFRVSITNAPGKNAYPISTFTWLLIPNKFGDAKKRDNIKAFLHWMLTTGQKDAEPLNYAPLPSEIVAKEQKQIDMIK